MDLEAPYPTFDRRAVRAAVPTGRAVIVLDRLRREPADSCDATVRRGSASA